MFQSYTGMLHEIYHRDNIKLNDESLINISTHENSELLR